MKRLIMSAVLAGVAAIPVSPADAHAVAGARVFVNTLTIDDPAVSDEASVPTFSWQGQPGSPATYGYNFNFEYDKRITEHFGFALNDEYTVLRSPGSPNQAGWQNLLLTLKYQAYVNAEHEFITSLGVIREFARTGSDNVGNDPTGTTTPTLYWGKGLGDLPIGWFRALGLTGTFGYRFADRALKTSPEINPDTGLASIVFNNGLENRWVGGLSIQYSIPYVQSQIRQLNLPELFTRLTPLVELSWSSPASRPSGLGTQYLIAPGVIYTGDTYGIGIEALIPGNGRTGRTIGVIAQFHVFIDDLFPDTVGKPLIQW